MGFEHNEHMNERTDGAFVRLFACKKITYGLIEFLVCTERGKQALKFCSIIHWTDFYAHWTVLCVRACALVEFSSVFACTLFYIHAIVVFVADFLSDFFPPWRHTHTKIFHFNFQELAAWLLLLLLLLAICAFFCRISGDTQKCVFVLLFGIVVVGASFRFGFCRLKMDDWNGDTLPTFQLCIHSDFTLWLLRLFLQQ